MVNLTDVPEFNQCHCLKCANLPKRSASMLALFPVWRSCSWSISVETPVFGLRLHRSNHLGRPASVWPDLPLAPILPSVLPMLQSRLGSTHSPLRRKRNPTHQSAPAVSRNSPLSSHKRTAPSCTCRGHVP